MVSARALEEPPPLENGDRLTMAEFERRYEAMPELKKAELIEGVVFLASPVGLGHSRGQSIMATWLGTYAAIHPECSVHTDGSVRLDADNEFQPDVFLWRPGAGTASEGERGLLDGPPDLVVEVASSSVSRDLFAKKHVYRRGGVREYIVWRVRDEAVDWFELRDGEYVVRQPDPGGHIESSEFHGLRLDVTALLRGDFAAVLAALR